MTTLSIQNMSKSFDGELILDDLSIQVGEGEFVSILGPSGSGKSTLFHVIGGLFAPDSGDIKLDGQSINGRRGSISYMPQSPSLLPWRTVIENVMLGQELHGKRDKEMAMEMIERAGLKGYEDAYPEDLSGGMKQRVAFIRALVSPQSFLCLDEPFSALDEFTRLDMQRWLLSIWEEDLSSVLFVTHNIDEALFLSDRIIVLSTRPARVQKEFKVPFPRPRDKEILLTEEFLKWKTDIFEELSQYV
ncbi:ABC transporter ATP-binding protein [Rossellomorea vietnamensis]|uniref:ABC transporter ATP-binding protein n=1 Tax=Rossellomorea vietnamensis TaxID=218284 RepID=UPI00077C3CCF|nr:ABC transporter ATP-binding protein [Rossellomorea vietnamensis]OXS56387.1 ABC transporter ATP-binding protein [Bacillus sp. DSM 27956]PRX72430.1 ABC-type nitrate/sulfonate/bicarbonate transport system ATPase subunit [Bacillus sp. V-88]SLK24307.1 ABC-type nitrate/sulfonate/bicarbonate transport system, ATPase component [Bacillus sp. V-88]